MKLLIILFLTSVIVSADDFLHRSYTCIKVAESNMLGNLKQTFNKESHILIHDMKNKKGFSYTLDNEKFTQIGQGNEFRTTNSNLFVSDYDHHYGDFLTIMLIQEGFVNDKKTKYTCIAKTSGYDLSQRGKTEDSDLAKVKKLMKQEYMACVDTQTQTTNLYDGLKDKNLETYSELSQIKQYREALLLMVSTCQKVYAFHKEVEQGESLEKLVSEAITNLEKNNKMESYCNARFNFCVDYDKNFGIEPTPENSDGRNFYDRDGFKMNVFGSNNTLQDTIKSELKLRSNNSIDKINYTEIYENLGVVSGQKGDNKVYIKILLTEGSFKIVMIEYPIALKVKYDPIAQTILASFRSMKK